VKRKIKHTSKLYEYLERKDALSGSDADIKQAKREYRRQYQAAWRKSKRATNQEITMSFNPQELRIITRASKRHKLSRPEFTKLAALAYLDHSYVVPDIFAINSIQESLIMTYSQVQKLFDENRISYEIGKELMQKINTLENAVLYALKQPERIEDRIKAEVTRNPGLVEILRELLKSVQS
jgi:hypothetical protein